MKRILSNGLVLLLLMTIYIAYTGRLNTITLLSGFTISLVITLFLGKSRTMKTLGVKLYHIIEYLYYFVVAIIREHIEVTKIILKPGIVIRPGFIEIPVKVESESSLALIALTITNTPGTIAVDVDKNRKKMIVHWIDVKSEDPDKAASIILGKLESILKNIFG
ncbi:MAG: Na+/H+ antiporter subunit E [Desulfurococcaceae archaeon]